MQRKKLSKVLNVYLYQTEVDGHKQFKLRTIETQPVEESPEVKDEIVLSLLSGCEKTFALCLNEVLDTLNAEAFPEFNYPPMHIFKKLCTAYSREIITDTDNPGQRYTYHDMDWVLFSEDAENNLSLPGDADELIATLATIDEAIQAFKQSAENDAYEVSIHFCETIPDFNDKLSIIRAAFAAPVSVPGIYLSHHISSWLYSAMKKDSTMTETANNTAEATPNIADDLLSPMLTAEEPSLRPVIYREIIHFTPQPQVSANPLTFFAHDLKAAVKPMYDEDELLSSARLNVN